MRRYFSLLITDLIKYFQSHTTISDNQRVEIVCGISLEFIMQATAEQSKFASTSSWYGCDHIHRITMCAIIKYRQECQI